MGIYDRDYMRRRPESDDARRSRPKRAVDWLSRFFDSHPHFGVWLAVVLTVLLLATLIFTRL